MDSVRRLASDSEGASERFEIVGWRASGGDTGSTAAGRLMFRSGNIGGSASMVAWEGFGRSSSTIERLPKVDRGVEA